MTQTKPQAASTGRWVPRDVPIVIGSLVVANAVVAPDLIDKPLAWEFAIFSSGYALAHSVFFAVPLLIAAVLVVRRAGRDPIGYGFAVGYLSHLIGDLIPIYAEEGELSLYPILWPFGDGSTTDHSQGFLDRFTELFVPYATNLHGELLASEPTFYTLFQLSLAAIAIFLWILDGMPLLSDLYTGLKARYMTQSSDST